MQTKSFYLTGSYKTHLPIKEMNKQAKAYWKRIDAIKKQSDIEHKMTMLRCWIITEKELLASEAVQ